MNALKVAVLHDWLVTWRGGEKCLKEIIQIYPEAEIYTLFIDLDIKEKYLKDFNVHTGILSKLPFVNKYYRLLLLFYPLDILFLSWKLRTHHRIKKYNFLISISHCAVKNIYPPKGLRHICYCLTPVRYIWDQYDSYFQGKWYEPIFRPIRKFLQTWDVNGSSRVNDFIAISNYISKRIEKYYYRDSSVVYPPVSVSKIASSNLAEISNQISNKTSNKLSFLLVNALVPYKNTKFVVEAFKELPYTLKIVGKGPELQFLKSIAPPNVVFLGGISDEDLIKEYASCSALLYAAEEDFGIVPLEAQGAGKPVICYSKGGCLETVIAKGEKRTGVYFDKLSSSSIINAVNEFIGLEKKNAFNLLDCKENASLYSEDIFRAKFKNEIDHILGHKEYVEKTRAVI